MVAGRVSAVDKATKASQVRQMSWLLPIPTRIASLTKKTKTLSPTSVSSLIALQRQVSSKEVKRSNLVIEALQQTVVVSTTHPYP